MKHAAEFDRALSGSMARMKMNIVAVGGGDKGDDEDHGDEYGEENECLNNSSYKSWQDDVDEPLNGCSNSKAVTDFVSAFDYATDLVCRLLNNCTSIFAFFCILAVLLYLKLHVNGSSSIDATNHRAIIYQYPAMVAFDFDGKVVSSELNLRQTNIIFDTLKLTYDNARRDEAVQTLPISSPQSIISTSPDGDESMEFLVAASLLKVESLKSKSSTIAADGSKTRSSSSNSNTNTNNKIDPFEWGHINPKLFVLNFDNEYILLLNRFNTMDLHALLVTKSFQEQSNLLTYFDLVYWMHLIINTDSLGVYNSNYVSGASQKHKHMQIIPRSVLNVYRLSTGAYASTDFPIPLEDAIHSFVTQSNEKNGNKALRYSQVVSLHIFHFRHGLVMLDPEKMSKDAKIGEYLLDCYEILLISLFPEHKSTSSKVDPASLSYNLLLTNRWMFMVKRTHREYGDGMVGINALAFAGLLLARDAEYVSLIEEIGPLNLLEKVSAPTA